MFITGGGGRDVNEYTLASAFNTATASFVDSFDISSQDTLPNGLVFNSDGTKMFVTGNQGNDINEYTLSTGSMYPVLPLLETLASLRKILLRGV